MSQRDFLFGLDTWVSLTISSDFDSEDLIFSNFLCAVGSDAVMCEMFSEIENDELGIGGAVWLKILGPGVSDGDVLPDNSFPYGSDQDILGLCRNGRASENVLLLLSVEMGRCIVLEKRFPGNRGIGGIGPGSDMEKGIKFGIIGNGIGGIP